MDNDVVRDLLWKHAASVFDIEKFAEFFEHTKNMATLHQDTATKYTQTLNALLNGPNPLQGSFADSLAGVASTLLLPNVDTSFDIQAEADAIVEAAQSGGEAAVAVTAPEVAGEATFEAAVTTGAAATGFNPVSAIIWGICTVVVAAAVVTALYEFDQQFRDLVNSTLARLTHIGDPTTTTTPQNMAKKVTVVPMPPAQALPNPCPPNPVQPFTQGELQELADLKKAFPDVDPDILERLVREGLSESDITDLINRLKQAFPNLNIDDALSFNSAFGLSDAQIQCLISNGITPPGFDFAKSPLLTKSPRFNSQMNKLWDTLRDHATPEDIDGAWRDYHPGCTTMSQKDHMQEIEEARQSLANERSDFQGINNSPVVTPAEKAILQAFIDAIDKFDAYLRTVIPGTTEPTLGPTDFFKDISANLCPGI